MIVLTLNILLYLALFLLLYKKTGKSVLSFLVFEYAFIAFAGVYTCWMGIYESTFGNKNFDMLTMWPYILCFVFLSIVIFPLRKVRLNYKEVPRSRLLSCVLYVWLIIMIAFTILKCAEVIKVLQLGLGEAYNVRHNLGETLIDYSGVPILHKLNTIGIIFRTSTVPFVVYYCVDEFYRGLASKKTYIMLIICFLPDIFLGIGGGSRGALFGLFMRMLFYYILFASFLSKRIKRKIQKAGMVVFAVLAFYSILITNERLDGTGIDSSSSIMRYFGESFPNLGFFFWENVRYHPMGDRLFPEFVGVNLSSQWESTDSMYYYWYKMTGTNVSLFKTLFGDVYIEFGTVGAFVFAIVLSLLFSFVVRKNITFFNIPLVVIYYQICTMGFAGLTQIGGFNNTLIYFSIVICLLLYMYYKRYLNRGYYSKGGSN